MSTLPSDCLHARLHTDLSTPFSSAFFNAHFGMAISLPDGRFQKVNASFCRMLGYPDEELQKMSVYDITHPEDQEQTRAFHEEVSAGKRDQFTYEKRYLRKDGSLIWAVSTTAWVFDSDRNPLYAIGMVQDITVFREKQEAMLAREKTYRLLVENIQLGISFTNSDYSIVMVNRTLADWFGKPPGEFAGKTCYIEFEKRNSVCAHCRAGEAMATGEPLEYFSEGVRDDGEAFSVRVQVFPLPKKNGKCPGFIEVIENITDRKRAEEALQRSEERFKILTDSAPIAIFESDEKGRNIYSNRQWERISGRSAEESLGDGWAEAVHPEERDSLLELWTRVAEGGGLWEKDFRLLRPDGETRFVRAFGAPIQKEGKIQGYVGSIFDVTARKKALQALAESENRFRSVFEHTQVGLCLFSPDGRLIQVNPAFSGLLGYEEHELLGKSLEEVTFHADREMTRKRLRESWESHTPIVYEKRYIRKDGAIIWAFVSGAWVHVSSGEPPYGISIVMDISARKDAESRMEHLSFYDQLTALPNRALLMDRLEHALAKARRSRFKVAVMVLDLDRFKNINDTYDHQMGDNVLIQVGRLIDSHIREADTLARFSGDEFVIVLEEVTELKWVEEYAEKILSLFDAPVSVGPNTFHLSASIGISVFPESGYTAERLLRSADSALHRAKSKGGSTYQFYNPEAGARSRHLVRLETEMRNALKQEQFILHYQPQVELATGNVVGMEALVRWRHPEKGLVPPGDFIPLAEESGLIIPIGRWVLKEACRQAVLWELSGSRRIAVNISARQFRRENLVDLVGEALKESGLPPECLELELTESMVMEDVEQAIKVMQALVDQGISLAIDDFGTGYSSLAYLNRFPISRLKIDRSFIKDITTDSNSAAIAGSIIDLARNMQLEVVAEGIETEEQKLFLLENGCRHGQGFLFGRPDVAKAS